MAKELTRITILRSSNAEKLQLNVSLAHTTLADIKNMIANEHAALLDCIGTTPSQQRIFHLGRELKSGGRTLEKLGVGRYRNNTILHLHVSKMTSNRTAESDNEDVVVVLPSHHPRLPNNQVYASSWQVAMQAAAPRTSVTGGNTSGTATTTTTPKQVIDLLDDDDSSDDDDAAVIVDPSSSSPKTKRQRV